MGADLEMRGLMVVMKCRLLTGLALALLAVVSLWPVGIAHGVEYGQISVLGGPAISVVGTDENNNFGVGVQGGLAVGVSDSFRLMVDGGYLRNFRADGDDGEGGTQQQVAGEQSGEGDFNLFRAGISAEYLVDVITWIPFLTAGVEWISVNGSQVPALMLGVGVDYQRWRTWALGGRILYHGDLSGQEGGLGGLFPSLITFSVNLRRIINPF